MLGILQIVLALNMLLQAAPAQPAPGDPLSATERAEIRVEQNVEQRIKIYHRASKRLQTLLEKTTGGDDFQAAPELLRSWTALLSESLKDIDANLKRKKSGPLRKFEIQVRKALSNAQNLKLKAPYEQQDLFESCLAEVEAVRKRFVEILFRN